MSSSISIGVDGGVNEDNAILCAQAGANVIVGACPLPLVFSQHTF